MTATRATSAVGDRSTSSPASGPRWTGCGTPRRTPTSTSAGTSASARSPTCPGATARPAALHLRDHGRSRRHRRRHRRVARRARPSRRHPLVGSQVLGERSALDHRRRCRLLALRAHRRRSPLPDPLRLPAPVGSARRGDRPVDLPARCSGGRPRGASTGSASGWRTAPRPNAPATRPSPTPRPWPGSSACSPTRASCPRSGRSTHDEVAIWQGLGLPATRARKLVRAVGAVEAGFAVATAARSERSAGRSSSPWPPCPTLAIGAAKSDRSILTKAFNPGSLGIAVAALAGVALATTRRSTQRPATAPHRTRPSARRGGTAMTSIYRRAARRRLRPAPPQDAVAVRVLVDRRDHARSAPVSWTRSGTARGGPCRSSSSGRPAGCCSPAGAATSPSPSPTTPTSIASGERPSPGHGRFTFPRAGPGLRRHDDPQQASATRSSTTSAPTSTSPSTSTAPSTTTAPCASAAASSASTRDAIAFRFPLVFSGVADVREWWDEDGPAVPHRGARRQQAPRPAVRLPGVLHRHRAPVHRRRHPDRRSACPGRGPRIGGMRRVSSEQGWLDDTSPIRAVTRSQPGRGRRPRRARGRVFDPSDMR